MSPRRVKPFADRTTSTTDLLLAALAMQVRDERRRRGWSLSRFAKEAGVSRSAVAALELGGRASIDRWVAVGHALGLELVMELADPRRRTPSEPRGADLVHAAMGELAAARLMSLGVHVSVDEPYQHYQFAGRGDVVGWTVDPPALIHLENRTRFPNVGEVAGSWNSKQRWLAPDLAKRIGIPGFASETHVMACLWSSEVLHELRRRPATFRALAQDPTDRFAAWWDGKPPEGGRSSSLILLDPAASDRQRTWVDLETALAGVRPRYRGYAEAAEMLERRSARAAS